MELLDFEQIDQGLAGVAAVERLERIIGTYTGYPITDFKITGSYWQCFIPGLGWRRVSEVLGGRG